MAKVISFSNHKGGVGKTTTLANVADAFANVLKKRVLVIDLDQQCNCSTAILGEGFVDEIGDQDAGQLFDRNSKYEPRDLVRKVSKNLSIIPGRHNDLFLVEQGLDEVRHTIRGDYAPKLRAALAREDLNESRDELQSLSLQFDEEIERDTNWQKILKRRISDIESEYDVILLDLPPSVSRIPINAWVASEYLVVPVSNKFALDGTAGLVRKMIEIKRDYNENLRFIFCFNMVLTGKNRQGAYISKNFQEMMATLRENLGGNQYLSSISYVMDSFIRHSRQVETAHKASKPVRTAFRNSPVANDYKEFTKELDSVISNN